MAAVGPHMGFGNEWQLDMKNATAVELMVVITFLQNVKRCHKLYLHRCSAMLPTIDQELSDWFVLQSLIRYAWWDWLFGAECSISII